MSVRWFIALALVLGVATVSVSSYLWLSRSELLARGGVRQARVDQQELEQQLVYLQDPDNRQRIDSLQQSLQELQLRLVELLTSDITSPGIDSITFEQSLLPDVIQVDTTSDMVTLRLVLHLKAHHSSAMLAFLATLRQSVQPWPNEIRACNMDRMPTSKINVICVVDFYHWSRLDGKQS